MKIGLRTFKTAISAALGMIIANALHLLYPSAAGIIALLSVTNTKRSSFKVGFYRLCSLALAIVISFGCFLFFGYTPLAFGVYLLLFIPVAVQLKMTEGIPVSSVLITHFLSEQSMSWSLIGNGFCLMIIGVGLALLMNLYMPNVYQKVIADQQKIEDKIRLLFKEMADSLNQPEVAHSCGTLLIDITQSLNEGETWARTHAENHLLSQDIYYLEYFHMRRVQIQMLQKMNQLVQKITVEPEQADAIRKLFIETSESFSETNDGVLIAHNIETVLRGYQETPLPKTRAEFENRARLYHLLTDFQLFIEIKVSFSADKNTEVID